MDIYMQMRRFVWWESSRYNENGESVLVVVRVGGWRWKRSSEGGWGVVEFFI